jgi:hypothetical protein
MVETGGAELKFDKVNNDFSLCQVDEVESNFEEERKTFNLDSMQYEKWMKSIE